MVARYPESGSPSERWAPVPGAGGDYWVSSDGRMWSRPRQTTRGGIMKTRADKDGYLEVAFTRARKRAVGTCEVHRIVALAFIGRLPAGLVTRHLDGCKTNNRVENLAYGTPAENSADAVRLGELRSGEWRTRCRKGHEFTEENTRRHAGVRRCLECTRAKNRRAKARYRERVQSGSSL